MRRLIPAAVLLAAALAVGAWLCWPGQPAQAQPDLPAGDGGTRFVASAGQPPRAAAPRECVVTPQIERAVSRGLDHLAKTQQPNGAWQDQYGQVPGVVGIAVLAFLAHGETPDEGKYGPVIRKGIDYIIKSQQPNGLLDTGQAPMYSHGFATLALAEAYGVIDDDRLGPALKKAVGLIVSAQNQQGGWRYSVGENDSDTTVSGAQMMALRAAANAGIEVQKETIDRAVKYYKSCFCQGGGFGYTGPGGPSPACSAIGTLVLALSGEYRSAEVKATADWLSGGSGLTRAGGSYMYYFSYYCSQAMYQAGGKYWRDWNGSVTDALIGMQQPDGSWPAGEAGITGDTAFALLAIEINYNLLPIYQR